MAEHYNIVGEVGKARQSDVAEDELPAQKLQLSLEVRKSNKAQEGGNPSAATGSEASEGSSSERDYVCLAWG